MESAPSANGCRARYLSRSKAATLRETTEGDLMVGSEQGSNVRRLFPGDGHGNGHVGLGVSKAGGIVRFDLGSHRM